MALTRENDILKLQKSYEFSNHPNSVIDPQWNNDYLFENIDINHRVINNHSLLFEKYYLNTSCLLTIYNDGVDPFYLNENYYNNFDPEVYDIIVRMHNTLDENGGTFYEPISRTATFGGLAPYVSTMLKPNVLWLDENGYVFTWVSHAPTTNVGYPEILSPDPLVPEVGNPKFMKGINNVAEYAQSDFTLIVRNQELDEFESFYLNSYNDYITNEEDDYFTVTFFDLLNHPDYTLAILPLVGDPVVINDIEISNINNTYEFENEINVTTNTIWSNINLICNNISIDPGCTLSIDGGIVTVVEDLTIYNESMLEVYNNGILNVFGALISDRLNANDDDPGIIANNSGNSYGSIIANKAIVNSLGNFELKSAQNGLLQLDDVSIYESGTAKLIRVGDGSEPICFISGEVEQFGMFENYDTIQFVSGSICTISGQNAEFVLYDGILNLDNSEFNIINGGQLTLDQFDNNTSGSELNLSNASVITITGSQTVEDAVLFLDWGSKITGCTPTTYASTPPGHPAGGETPIPGDRIIAENGGVVLTDNPDNFTPGVDDIITVASNSGLLWDGIFIKNPDQDASYWFVNCNISGIRKLSIENVNESQNTAELKLYKTDFHDAGQIVVRDGHLLYIHGTDGFGNLCNIYNNYAIPITVYESRYDISFCDVYSNETGIYIYEMADSNSTINNCKLHHNDVAGVRLSGALVSFYNNDVHNNDHFGILAYPGTVFYSLNVDEQFDNLNIYRNGDAEYVGWPSTYNMGEQRTSIIFGDIIGILTETCLLMNVGWNNTLDPVDIQGVTVYADYAHRDIVSWIDSLGYVNLFPSYPEPWDIGEEISEEKLLLQSAMYDIGMENFTIAKSTLQTIISDYPLSLEAGTAVYYLYHLTSLSDKDFFGLITYLENTTAEPESFLEKAIKDVITKSYMKDKDYISAIDRLEYVIENSQYPDEVILAMIDEGYCYMELAGQEERALPQNCTIKTATLESYQLKVKELERQLSFFPEDSENNIIPAGKVSEVINYPNPFNPTTTIAFSLSTDSDVSINIYNIKGQKVKQLIKEQLEAGKHKVDWSGIDNSGKSVASGIYFYKISTGKDTDLRKMLLLK